MITAVNNLQFSVFSTKPHAHPYPSFLEQLKEEATGTQAVVDAVNQLINSGEAVVDEMSTKDANLLIDR
jgi:hypothetical protein